MNYAIFAKLGIAAVLTVGLSTPATALAEAPVSNHATSTVSSASAGDITLR